MCQKKPYVTKWKLKLEGKLFKVVSYLINGKGDRTQNFGDLGGGLRL